MSDIRVVTLFVCFVIKTHAAIQKQTNYKRPNLAPTPYLDALPGGLGIAWVRCFSRFTEPLVVPSLC